MMNIDSPNSLRAYLGAADANGLPWIVSYATISDATAGITDIATRQSGGAIATINDVQVAMVIGEAGVTKQVKNINILNDSGGPVDLYIELDPGGGG